MNLPSTKCARCTHRRDAHKGGTGKCCVKTLYEGLAGKDGRCACTEFLEPDGTKTSRRRKVNTYNRFPQATHDSTPVPEMFNP